MIFHWLLIETSCIPRRFDDTHPAFTCSNNKESKNAIKYIVEAKGGIYPRAPIIKTIQFREYDCFQ